MKEFESDTIKIDFDSFNKIYKMTLKKEIINLRIAETIIKERAHYTKNDNILLYVDCSKVKIFEKDARDYLASNEANKNIIAYTMYAKSSFSEFLANFILKVNLNGLKTPRKFFSNEQKALKWLKTF